MKGQALRKNCWSYILDWRGRLPKDEWRKRKGSVKENGNETGRKGVEQRGRKARDGLIRQYRCICQRTMMLPQTLISQIGNIINICSLPCRCGEPGRPWVCGGLHSRVWLSNCGNYPSLYLIYIILIISSGDGLIIVIHSKMWNSSGYSLHRFDYNQTGKCFDCP